MREAFAQAAAAIAANPLRSALGAVAIAAAVATIVGVTTALDGVRRYAEQSTARTFGSNTFLIAQVASPGRVPRRQLQEQLARNPPIRRSDAAFLNRHARDAVVYALNAQARAEVSRDSRTLEGVSVTGTSASLERMRDLNLVDGRFLSEAEDRNGSQVAVIGADVVDALFPSEPAVGRAIRLAGRRFDVIGIQGRLGNPTLDKYVWIPMRAFERAFGAPRSLQIFATAAGGGPATAAEDHARISLRAARALRPGTADTFDVLAPEAARGFVANLSDRIGAAALPISLMALLAAIVVVSNTVLVSVSQRTREIGVRRAVGARRAQIIREVLAEGILISAAGGVAGIALVGLAIIAVSAAAPVPLTMQPLSLVAALAGAVGSGLVAGVYPAFSATRLDVVGALRSE